MSFLDYIWISTVPCFSLFKVIPPISLSTTYKQGRPGEPKKHDYSRAGNPTRDVLEKCVAALEDGEYCKWQERRTVPALPYFPNKVFSIFVKL